MRMHGLRGSRLRGFLLLLACFLCATAPARAADAARHLEITLTLSPLTPPQDIARFQQELVAREAELYRAVPAAYRLKVPLLAIATTSDGVNLEVTVLGTDADAEAIGGPLRKALAGLASMSLPPDARFAFGVGQPSERGGPLNPAWWGLVAVVVLLGVLVTVARALAHRRARLSLRFPCRYGHPVLAILPTTENEPPLDDLALVLGAAYPAGLELVLVGLDGMRQALLDGVAQALQRRLGERWRVRTGAMGECPVLVLAPAGASERTLAPRLHEIPHLIGLILVGSGFPELEDAVGLRVMGSRLTLLAGG